MQTQKRFSRASGKSRRACRALFLCLDAPLGVSKYANGAATGDNSSGDGGAGRTANDGRVNDETSSVQ